MQVAQVIAAAIDTLAEVVLTLNSGRDGEAPDLLLLAPPPFGTLSEFAEMFAGGSEKSLEFARRYKDVASTRGCYFLDTGTLVRSSDLDGIHLDGSEHRKLGRALAALVGRILPD